MHNSQVAESLGGEQGKQGTGCRISHNFLIGNNIQRFLGIVTKRERTIQLG